MVLLGLGKATRTRRCINISLDKYQNTPTSIRTPHTQQSPTWRLIFYYKQLPHLCSSDDASSAAPPLHQVTWRPTEAMHSLSFWMVTLFVNMSPGFSAPSIFFNAIAPSSTNPPM